MTFQCLSPDAYAAAVAARYGFHPLTGPEAIADVARSELFAFGHTRRWVLAQRLLRKLLSAFAVTSADVEDVLRTLEATGDLSAGPFGEVACAPLRGVALGAGRWLLLGTLPTGELRARLGVAVAGLPRRLSLPDDSAVSSAVAALGGRVLSVERWAGLDRHPPVSGWLGELRERLDTALRFADRAGLLQWTDLEVYRPRAAGEASWDKYVPEGAPALVRARQAGGWMAYAWAERTAEALTLVPLTGDEARRTRFAVDAEAAASLRVEATPCEGGVEFALPVLLPAAEYRYLSALGEMKQSPRRVRLDPGAFGAAAALLRERLGFVVEPPRSVS